MCQFFFREEQHNCSSIISSVYDLVKVKDWGKLEEFMDDLVYDGKQNVSAGTFIPYQWRNTGDTCFKARRKPKNQAFMKLVEKHIKYL